MLLSKEELKIQKKGIENLSPKELLEWIDICERNEKNVKFKKARRSWIESRKKAEIKLEQNT
jgi:hypothetical protein